jgi:hypothetical protein
VRDSSDLLFPHGFSSEVTDCRDLKIYCKVLKINRGGRRKAGIREQKKHVVLDVVHASTVRREGIIICKSLRHLRWGERFKTYPSIESGN